MRKKITYKSAGVDVAGADRFIAQIKGLVKSTHRQGWLGTIGGFGAFFEVPKGYKEPVLVSSSDGVGTKLKIAFLADRHHTVGIDLVAMNVNDCVCCGAQPLFFLDYIAAGKLEKRKLVSVMKGLVRGCKDAGCALIGGETAEMPDFYPPGEYDLSGFSVAVVERKKIINGSGISRGDAIIGLASSGLHSNGFSLIRKIFSQKELKKRAKEFLTPTRIYAKPVLSLLRLTNRNRPFSVKGIAHITGGAFFGKIPRVLPKGLSAQICKNSWPIPPIFQEIKSRAQLDYREMFQTLNMGIGMILVVSPRSVNKTLSFLKRKRLPAWEIGEIVRGRSEVIL